VRRRPQAMRTRCSASGRRPDRASTARWRRRTAAARTPASGSGDAPRSAANAQMPVVNVQSRTISTLPKVRRSWRSPVLIWALLRQGGRDQRGSMR
jgi:hypothetical protein